MWSFGHSVREIERSHERVVIEETPTTAAVWLFGAFALLTLFLAITLPESSARKTGAETVGVLAILFFASFALWASVRSTFTADRRSCQLAIKRKILFWTTQQAYDAHTIDKVYVRNTQKGSGLYVRFNSGRKKRLTMTLEFIALEEFAFALNTALYTRHEQ